MKALNSGGGMGLISALQMKKDRLQQGFDRRESHGSGDPTAVDDPVGYARGQVKAIDELSDRLGEGCEAALSDDAYNPDMIQHRLGSL
jgi:hypothetical protein